MKKTNRLLELFLTQLKTGAFTFGGGYAMISILENEFVERKKWLEHDEFMDIIAISESTPGPIAINSATYIGYKVGGVIGSAIATLGVVLPSFVIIYLISLFYDKFMTFTAVAAAFKGIQACVVYLILSAGIKMFKKMEKKPLYLIMTGVVILSLIATTLFAVKFSSIYYILIGAAIGVFAYGISSLVAGVKK